MTDNNPGTVSAQQLNAWKYLQRRAVEDGVQTQSRVAELTEVFTKGSREEQKALIAEQITLVRDMQTKIMVGQLRLVTHNRLEQKLSQFAQKLQGPEALGGSTCTHENGSTRRDQLKDAICRMMKKSWSLSSDELDKMCAYDFIVGTSGQDDLVNYVRNGFAFRQAATELFEDPDPKNFCTATDAALLCLDHDVVKRSEVVVVYDIFNQHAAAFIGQEEADEGEKFMKTRKMGGRKAKEESARMAFIDRVHARRGRDSPAGDKMPAKYYSYWGDVRDRIVCSQFFHVVETMLLHNPLLQWQNVQQKYKDAGLAMKTTGRGASMRHSAAYHLEEHEGEIAAEMVAILWRIFNNDRSHVVINAARRMPDLPTHDTNAFYVFDDDSRGHFAIPSGLVTSKQLARLYVYQAMYTSLNTCWFLSAPAAPALYCALQRGAVSSRFLERSMRGTPAVEDITVPQIVVGALWRSYCLNLADGTAAMNHKTISEHLYEKTGEKPKDWADPLGDDYFRKFLKIASNSTIAPDMIMYLYDKNPYAFKCVAGTVLVVGGIFFAWTGSVGSGLSYLAQGSWSWVRPIAVRLGLVAKKIALPEIIANYVAGNMMVYDYVKGITGETLARYVMKAGEVVIIGADNTCGVSLRDGTLLQMPKTITCTSTLGKMAQAAAMARDGVQFMTVGTSAADAHQLSGDIGNSVAEIINEDPDEDDLEDVRLGKLLESLNAADLVGKLMEVEHALPNNPFDPSFNTSSIGAFTSDGAGFAALDTATRKGYYASRPPEDVGLATMTVQLASDDLKVKARALRSIAPAEYAAAPFGVIYTELMKKTLEASRTRSGQRFKPATVDPDKPDSMEIGKSPTSLVSMNKTEATNVNSSCIDIVAMRIQSTLDLVAPVSSFLVCKK